MKLFFNLFFLLTGQVYGMDAIKITFQRNQTEQAKLIQAALVEDLFIPQELISIQETKQDPCEIAEQSLWQICIWNDELFFPQMDQEVLAKSYQVFWQELP